MKNKFNCYAKCDDCRQEGCSCRKKIDISKLKKKLITGTDGAIITKYF